MSSDLMEVKTENFIPKTQKDPKSAQVISINKSRLAANITRALNTYLKENPKITVFSEIINFFKKNKYENVEYYQLYNYILNQFSGNNDRYILEIKNDKKSRMENLIDEIDSEFNKNTSLNVILNKEERYIELDLMRALDYLTHKNIESKFANIKKEKKEAEVEIELELKNKKLQAENNPGINPNPPSETTYLAKKTKRESNETKEKKEEENKVENKEQEKAQKGPKKQKRAKFITLLNIGNVPENNTNTSEEKKENGDNNQTVITHTIDEDDDMIM